MVQEMYMMLHTNFQHPRSNATFLRVIAAYCTRALIDIIQFCKQREVSLAEIEKYRAATGNRTQDFQLEPLVLWTLNHDHPTAMYIL